MLSSDAVEKEGFVPLKRTSTQPSHMPSKPHLDRTISFNPETGEKEDVKAIWENSSWAKLDKQMGRNLVRANSFASGRSRTLSSEESKEMGAIAIVDPFSTGAHLARAACQAGYKCIRVFSIWDSPVAALVQEGVNVEFSATVQYNDQLEDENAATNAAVDALRALNMKIIAVIPGAETGVELADRLSFRMGLRSNGEEGSLARRNKYLMGEKVRNFGVRAVKQRLVTTIEDMMDFLKTLSPTGVVHSDMELRCVVKPVQSAGSDDVYLCKTVAEAETAFKTVFGKRNGLGLMNEDVLVQEFLQGKEYVVDKVSKDGVHKVVAIWEYDKRPVNGASFVYFGMRLMPADTAKSQELIRYADGVLDALGIRQGPSHMEVMYCADGPCLVEVGSRCHGGEGSWLPVAHECIGYTVVSVVLDVYTNGPVFDTLPATSYVKMKAGREVDMVARHPGIIRSKPGDAKIRALASFRSFNWEVKDGDFQPQTIDCFTRPGSVQLVNDSEEQAEADLEAIHDLEEMGLFDYAVICPNPPVVGAVVVVDPFSTGANLAAAVLKWGYKLIIIFSEMEGGHQAVLSRGHTPSTLLIQHDSRATDSEKALQDTLEKLRKQPSPVLAILAGAQTGTALAETLAFRLKTRHIGPALTATRHDRSLQQQRLVDNKLAVFHQQVCANEEEVRSFVRSLPNEGRCIVLPRETLSTHPRQEMVGATMEANVAAAVAAFAAIRDNKAGVVVQQLVHGTEYIVDAVSRDGVYKVVALWEYEPRRGAGAGALHRAMRLRAVDRNDAAMDSVIQFAQRAATALGYVQGPSHLEVLLTEAGPRLVEASWRCHGGLGTWLPIAQECIGYTQIDATLNCFLRPDRFDALPATPSLTQQGMEVFLFCNQTGVVREIPALESIRSLSSVHRLDMNVQAGSNVVVTDSEFTSPGSVLLVGQSVAELNADLNEIQRLEEEGLFALM